MIAKQDAEKLMNGMLPVAERMLKSYEEFYPYGGWMALDGAVTHLGATDLSLRPKSKDLLFLLREALKEVVNQGNCKAVAVVCNVSVTLPASGGRSDAIQLCVEHVDGYSVDIVFPYRVEGRGVIFGETAVQKKRQEFFFEK